MKKVSRKLLALLLILTMVFTLAACGNSDKADKETGTDVQASDDTDAADSGDTDAGDAAATEPPATPTTVPDKYEAFDFGGRTVKVATWYDVYYTSDHSSIEEDPKLTDAETAQMKLDNVRRIEEKYKCKIQFVNMGWSGIMNSVSTSIAAGTPECDIYMVDLQFGFPAVFNGLAQELSAVALEGSDLLGAHEVLESMKIDVIDGTYLFRVTEPATYGIFMGYNATMIQDLGLDDPQELYKNGQWTWDKMAQMAKQAQGISRMTV
jgi:multiple sugar transport system substrate-binding protein